MKIKLIITDIDGVWTDGGMYYFNDGQEAKKFNTSDSVGVTLAQLAKIDLVVISGEDIPALRNRLRKLGVSFFYLGVKDKLALVKRLAFDREIKLKEMAFIGDEINDHPLLKEVGFSCCPISAPNYTKQIVDYITPTEGGKGAFRDFVVEILRKEDILEKHFNHLVKV